MKNKFIAFFSSGLWIIVLLALTTVGLAFKEIIIPLANGDFTRTIGDGVHVSSYDFNLHPLLINRGLLVASGNSKDGLNALTHPRLLTPRQVSKINDARRDAGGFMQGPDRVVGVVIHGQARAYPLPMMNWHEVCNDRLGGKAIAVIWDGFCDTALVVSRRVHGRILRFGYSGLVYNGNALIYDHEPKVADESLWSPIAGRAVAGPMAADHARLTALPCQVVTWRNWKSMYPDTTMIAGITSLYAAYRKDVYGPYDHSPAGPRYPVAPLWNHRNPRLKSSLILLRIQHHWRPLLFSRLFARQNRAGVVHLKLAGVPIVLQCFKEPQWRTVTVNSPQQLPTAYGFLFAWYAQHPGDFSGRRWPATPAAADKGKSRKIGMR
jgi:hypothetical protein